MTSVRTGALCVALLAAIAQASAAAPLRIPGTTLEPVEYEDLDGWKHDDQAAAFAAFRHSCDAILRRAKAKVAVAGVELHLREICERAAHYRKPVSALTARIFFEQNFRPVRIAKLGESDGFITGYYEPVIEGSRTAGNGYTVPFYRMPRTPGVTAAKSGKRRRAPRVSFPDRAAIEDGALAGRGLEICWVKDPIDAFFTHIQGSARVRMPDGKLLRINYAAQNGHPYLAVGRVLIERGIVPKDEMTMDKIRTFISEFPEEGRELMRMNRSYIFFREVEELGAEAEPMGAQGVSLTRDRSIAVDKSIHVYGTPFWIEAELPIESEQPTTRYRRLVLAQDTGGAIIGPARADIYFGAGIDAGTVAGRLRHSGRFYMLVPRAMDPGKPVAAIPMPPKRPAL